MLDEVAIWQNRPLEPVYPLVFFDALRIKVRDEGLVRNKATHSHRLGRPDVQVTSIPDALHRTQALSRGSASRLLRRIAPASVTPGRLTPARHNAEIRTGPTMATILKL